MDEWPSAGAGQRQRVAFQGGRAGAVKRPPFLQALCWSSLGSPTPPLLPQPWPSSPSLSLLRVTVSLLSWLGALVMRRGAMSPPSWGRHRAMGPSCPRPCNSQGGLPSPDRPLWRRPCPAEPSCPGLLVGRGRGAWAPVCEWDHGALGPGPFPLDASAPLCGRPRPCRLPSVPESFLRITWGPRAGLVLGDSSSGDWTQSASTGSGKAERVPLTGVCGQLMAQPGSKALGLEGKQGGGLDEAALRPGVLHGSRLPSPRSMSCLRSR